MTTPWLPAAPLDPRVFAELRRRAIFDCCKWDPQVGDTCAIARAPLIVSREAWTEVARIAEALARETRDAEQELLGRPELHGVLGLPRTVRRALRRAADEGAPSGVARLIRFDFHFTTEGWRISEANADVPGGLNEASGLPLAIAPYYPEAAPVGDPAARYADAIVRRAGRDGVVALIHATAFSDDQQMMRYVAARLDAAGLRTHVASPAHLRWVDGRAALEADWWRGPLDLVVRFFPAEWLPGLPAVTGWPALFAGARTPISNPATAILTQSKRFPLVWRALRTALPAWRAHLPETRDPRDAPWRNADDWVLKPALGRVGEGVGVRGAVEARELRRIERQARIRPGAWVAQRRFAVVPADVGGARAYPCLGVYTLDGLVVGAYGRIAPVPLIDGRAADAGVLAA